MAASGTFTANRILLASGLLAAATLAVWIIAQVANLSSQTGFIIWTPIMAAIIAKVFLPKQGRGV
jgi:hypothetical protein